MATLDALLARLEELLAGLDHIEEPLRSEIFELLDGIDALHRAALARLADALDAATVQALRERDPALRWLFDAYSVGIDEFAAADAALESVRPYIHSHGGEVEVLSVDAGVVRLRLSGTCSGCTASAVTLQEGVERALREGFPGFVVMEVEEDAAPPHPPPQPLLQIQPLQRR